MLRLVTVDGRVRLKPVATPSMTDAYCRMSAAVMWRFCYLVAEMSFNAWLLLRSPNPEEALPPRSLDALLRHLDT